MSLKYNEDLETVLYIWLIWYSLFEIIINNRDFLDIKLGTCPVIETPSIGNWNEANLETPSTSNSMDMWPKIVQEVYVSS